MRPHSVSAMASCALLLAGCATNAPDPALAERRLRLSALVADDPHAEARVRRVACRIDASWCATLRIFVLKGDAPVADHRAGGVLRISQGLLRRATDDAALAFVLAHEHAHVTLGHAATRGDTPAREVAADAAARGTLATLGVDEGPALAMLRALLDEARRNPDADPAGLAELEARVGVLEVPR